MTLPDTRPPVIACYLNPLQIERLRRHRSQPVVIDYAAERPVWEPPPDADILMTFMSRWYAAPKQPPAGWPGRLRWIQVASVGVDAFPPWFFDGPVVTCGRGVQSAAIAEYVLAAILLHEKRFDEMTVRRAEDWVPAPLGGVKGRTVGIAGLGAIGREVADRALAFGAQVAAVRRSRGAAGARGIAVVDSLEELFAMSDHLVLALPLTAETRGIVGDRVLAAAKPGLHLVNVSRGALVDTEALGRALDGGRIGFATLDVTEPEPLPAGHAFYGHPKVRLTPHVAGRSHFDDDLLSEKLARNLDLFLAGEPLPDVVDRTRGY